MKFSFTMQKSSSKLHLKLIKTENQSFIEISSCIAKQKKVVDATIKVWLSFLQNCWLLDGIFYSMIWSFNWAALSLFFNVNVSLFSKQKREEVHEPCWWWHEILVS